MNERRKIPIEDIFTDDFIQRHSHYNSLQEMIHASDINGIDDILKPPFRIFCTYMTDFHSFDLMCEAAKAEYLQRKRSPKV